MSAKCWWSFSPSRGLFAYAGYVTLAFGIISGLVRSFYADSDDPQSCARLLNHGRWLEGGFQKWQPAGCMSHTYTSEDLPSCLASRPIVFIGDSVTRLLFFRFAHIVDPTLPTEPTENSEKHADQALRAADGTSLAFFWDPYLNGSRIASLAGLSSSLNAGEPPVLLVIGSGLWYLHLSPESGGVPGWSAQVDAVLDGLRQQGVHGPDEIAVLPVEQVVRAKLSPDRAQTMGTVDISAMNAHLAARVSELNAPIYLPLVFNKMLDASQTEDGLHFSADVVQAQADILLNHRCNKDRPQNYPYDATCCWSYPRPSWVQALVLSGALLSAPLVLAISKTLGYLAATPAHFQAVATIGLAASLLFLADRSTFWLKEGKEFDPWSYGILNLAALAIALATTTSSGDDLGFLHRDQTDEWKGWMQVAILLYHYFGASKISVIYNPIRVLVAAYLFMTGYGHTSFYLKKADFSFKRVSQVLFRINLFTVVLAYVMDTNYLFYYFTPLISIWFLIVYATMALGAQHNPSATFLTFKIVTSALLVAWCSHSPWLTEHLFVLLQAVFGIRWPAREWAFRFGLDVHVPFLGMLVALGAHRARAQQAYAHPLWPRAVLAGMLLAVCALGGWAALALGGADKRAYNAIHPIVSGAPVLAYAVLRNAHPALRGASSRFFIYVGRISLETFVIQYHFWLAADTKGVLVVLPGRAWKGANGVLVTAMFGFLAHRVAGATGVLTEWVCAKPPQVPAPVLLLPTVTQAVVQAPRDQRVEDAEDETPLMAGNHAEGVTEGNTEDKTEEETTRRLDDGAAHGTDRRRGRSGAPSWANGVRLGMKGKLAAILLVMWVLNLLWPVE